MRRPLSAVALAGLILLAGCGGEGEDEWGSAPASCPSTVTVAPDAGLPQVPAGCPTPEVLEEPLHDHELPDEAPAHPTWTEDDATATRLLALDVLRAFALDLPAEAWFETLASYLTADAQTAFYGTDPALVPVHDVYDATVTSPSPYLADAIATTDAGPYRVLMVRDGAGEPWRVDRIEPAG